MNYENHLISQNTTIIDALRQIQSLAPHPLILFALDVNKRMVGTLTDGDIRRALIANHSLLEYVENVMNKHFNYIRQNTSNLVKDLHYQRVLKMKLVPVLDNQNHIADIF